MEETTDEVAATAATYDQYARHWFAGHSAIYTAWASRVAADRDMASLIASLPPAKRQPNLVFAASRFLGCPDRDADALAHFLHDAWPQVSRVVMERRTQTNEPRRCATLLPALGLIAAADERPLALIEVGPSAGLCLLPDLYSYEYDGGPRLGTASPLLRCTTTGNPPLPSTLPRVASRTGVDLNPLDATDPDTVRWLECLVWPGQEDRLQTLRAALGRLASLGAEGPSLLTGDLNDRVAELVAAVPDSHHAVVFHSAVLAYLSPADRSRFAATIRSLDCRWLSNENFFLDEAGLTVNSLQGDRFTLALDSVPLAYTGQHGATLDWIG